MGKLLLRNEKIYGIRKYQEINDYWKNIIWEVDTPNSQLLIVNRLSVNGDTNTLEFNPSNTNILRVNIRQKLIGGLLEKFGLSRYTAYWLFFLDGFLDVVGGISPTQDEFRRWYENKYVSRCLGGKSLNEVYGIYSRLEVGQKLIWLLEIKGYLDLDCDEVNQLVNGGIPWSWNELFYRVIRNKRLVGSINAQLYQKYGITLTDNEVLLERYLTNWINDLGQIYFQLFYSLNAQNYRLGNYLVKLTPNSVENQLQQLVNGLTFEVDIPTKPLTELIWELIWINNTKVQKPKLAVNMEGENNNQMEIEVNTGSKQAVGGIDLLLLLQQITNNTDEQNTYQKPKVKDLVADRYKYQVVNVLSQYDDVKDILKVYISPNTDYVDMLDIRTLLEVKVNKVNKLLLKYVRETIGLDQYSELVNQLEDKVNQLFGRLGVITPNLRQLLNSKFVKLEVASTRIKADDLIYSVVKNIKSINTTVWESEITPNLREIVNILNSIFVQFHKFDVSPYPKLELIWDKFDVVKQKAFVINLVLSMVFPTDLGIAFKDIERYLLEENVEVIPAKINGGWGFFLTDVFIRQVILPLLFVGDGELKDNVFKPLFLWDTPNLLKNPKEFWKYLEIYTIVKLSSEVQIPNELLDHLKNRYGTEFINQILNQKGVFIQNVENILAIILGILDLPPYAQLQKVLDNYRLGVSTLIQTYLENQDTTTIDNLLDQYEQITEQYKAEFINRVGDNFQTIFNLFSPLHYELVLYDNFLMYLRNYWHYLPTKVFGNITVLGVILPTPISIISRSYTNFMQPKIFTNSYFTLPIPFIGIYSLFTNQPMDIIIRDADIYEYLHNKSTIDIPLGISFQKVNIQFGNYAQLLNPKSINNYVLQFISNPANLYNPIYYYMFIFLSRFDNTITKTIKLFFGI